MESWISSLIIFCLCMSQKLLQSKEGKRPVSDKKYTLLDLFRTPNIRKLSIYLGLVW